MYQNFGIKVNKFAGSAQNTYEIMHKDDLMCRKRVRICENSVAVYYQMNCSANLVSDIRQENGIYTKYGAGTIITQRN
jgi:hypothetical protein